jgi:hypothetical protein
MTTLFSRHSVTEGDRAARMWTRNATLSPLDAGTPDRVRHSLTCLPHLLLPISNIHIRSILICQLLK